MIKASFSLQKFREQLADYEALPQLVILGLLSGICCGLLIALFRFAIDLPLFFLLSEHIENFEALPPATRFAFPIIGSVILALLFKYWHLMRNKVGIVHLLERLAFHQANIPGKNLVAQFIAATVALISGHSVGREGPAIYMGACLSSLIGQRLHIPHNSQRLLVACGAAAAISAAFNTPLAGVIFAMEVILLDYTVAGFTPIIVAAVSGNLVIRLIFSSAPIFSVPAFEVSTFAEVPWIAFIGIVIGLLSVVFTKTLLATAKLKHWNLSGRFLLAGLITAIVALYYPQIMGTGYDTITDAMWGRLDISLLLGILLAKLLVTPIILGLGIPAGLIGPTLFIGALAGATLGFLGNELVDISTSHIGFYAMLGMGAMMAAVLNAPLAALIALLELTNNPNIIFPSMIAIIISNLTARHLFKTPSVFLASLQAQGLDYRQEPLAQILSRASVASIMGREFTISPAIISQEQAYSILKAPPAWILIEDQSDSSCILDPIALSSFLERKITIENDQLDLMRIPAQRIETVYINVKSTLHEAFKMMEDQQTELLVVKNNEQQISGFISRSQIEQYYSNKQYI